jgi:hypothetical protein
MNNSRFDDFLHFPYPNELEVKDTNNTRMSTDEWEVDYWRSEIITFAVELRL